MFAIGMRMESPTETEREDIDSKNRKRCDLKLERFKDENTKFMSDWMTAAARGWWEWMSLCPQRGSAVSNASNHCVLSAMMAMTASSWLMGSNTK